MEEEEEEESDDDEEEPVDLLRENVQMHEDLAFMDAAFPEDDFVDEDMPENPRGEVDIRGVLLDVLGFRGKLNNILRNTIWLLMFNALYLGIFASIPLNLGSFYCSVFSYFCNAMNFVQWLGRQWM